MVFVVGLLILFFRLMCVMWWVFLLFGSLVWIGSVLFFWFGLVWVSVLWCFIWFFCLS